MTTRIIPVNPHEPSEEAIAEAAALLEGGGIIAYPTETFYGLGADGTNEDAIDRIFHIKGRQQNVPISLIIADWYGLEPLVAAVPAAARRLAAAFWPGGITMIFKASTGVSKKLTAGTGTIGIRLSSDPLATLIARRLGRPITATSANRSGGAECASAAAVLAALGDDVDVVVDGGTTAGPPGSTIVDVSVNPPRIVRHGVVSDERIEAALRGL